MLKAIALKDLRIEEGIFVKGDTFAPGYTHSLDGNPHKRILHVNCAIRASQLSQTKDIMVLSLEYDKEDLEKHLTVLSDINDLRRITYNGVLQPVQLLPDTVSDSNPDEVESTPNQN